MTTLVTFRLDDEDAAALQYREGPKGVYRPQCGPPKTRRIPAEPVAIRPEYEHNPQSNSTLTAADACQLEDLILAAFSAGYLEATASYERRAEVWEASKRAETAVWKFINERVDDIHESNRLSDDRGER